MFYFQTQNSYYFLQNYFIFTSIVFTLSSFRQKDMSIVHVHSKYEHFDLISGSQTFKPNLREVLKNGDRTL